MGDIKQINFFQGGLNLDDAHIAMPNGDYPYAFNVFVGEDGLHGVRVNFKGNRQITYPRPLTLSQTYACVGSYYNAVTRKAYSFIFSQPYDSGSGVYLHDNRLICFNEDSETIEDIFIDQHNYFGLSPYELLTDIRMIESWLFFRTDSKEPKMIDVDMAYNYTNYPAYDDTDPSFSAIAGDTYTYKGGVFVANQAVSAGEDPVNSAAKWDRMGDCYDSAEIVEGFDMGKSFYAIKIPPFDRIRADYGSDLTANFNNVEQRIFRFCHRYQYFDDTYSVCSAHSDLVLPLDGEVYNGEKAGSVTRNNYIRLAFSLYSASLVKNVEILFQELIRTPQTWSDWKRLTVINRQDRALLDTTDYSYNFYNNESYPTAPEGIADVIYDAVPKKARAQEVINKNVLCYGGCTEGFNNLEKSNIDVTLTPVIEDITIPDAVVTINVRRNSIQAGDITNISAGITVGKQIAIDSWAMGTVVTGDIYKVTIDGKTESHTLTAGEAANKGALATAVASFLQSKFPIYNSQVVSGNVQIWSSGGSPIRASITDSIFYGGGTVQAELTKKRGFKTAAYEPFCLFYYDEALRRCDAQVSSNTTVYVPSVNDYTPHVDETSHRWKITWAVNHEPPTWAKYWKWGKANNRRCSYFVQYILGGMADGGTVAGFVKTVVTNTVALDVSPLNTISTTTTSGWNCYPNSIIPPIDDSVSYRVRFMTEATDPASAGVTTLGDAVDGMYDFPVIKIDTENNVIYVPDFTYSPTFGVNTLVELYVPVTSLQAETYYEYGEMMPILEDVNGNRVHGGQTQNQIIGAGVQAATGIFDKGDVYHIMRTPSKPLDNAEPTTGAFHESMWYSDFYDSDDWDRGKIGIESSIGEQTLNIIRYSNPYLQNTQVNGITTFGVNSFKELNDTYGDIRAMVEVGNTLKVYQEKKSCSIGIGRTEYQDASGDITVVGSDQVLGVVRYSNKNYGTTFPESIAKNNRYVYGFDAYQGTPWRDTPNGIHSIGGRYEELGGARDYKMSSYFKAKAKALLTSGVEHCNVFSVWDEQYDMLYLVFKDLVNKENDETVVFHEPTDRWITFADMSYTPEGGFNEMLELTYSVTRGFDIGLDHYFDEESRFEVFNIVTPINDYDFPALDTLTIESFDPTWYTDSVSAQDLDTLVITSLDPTPVVSYVAISVAGDTWASTAYGSGNSHESYMTCYPSPALITAIPSWMAVAPKVAPLAPYSVGDTIPSGTMLVFYPTSANEGAKRTGNITLANSNGGFLDTDSYVAVQNAPVAAPTVYVYVDPTNPSDMTLTGLSGSMLPGDDSVNITFTPNHEDYTSGQIVPMFWKFVVDGGAMSSSYPLSAEDGIENSLSISLPYAINSGSIITIYLRGVASTDGIATPDLSTATITSYDPTAISSACAITSVAQFAYNEDSFAEGKTATVTASGAPPDPTMNVTIMSKPSWIVIWHGDEGTGYALYEGMTISDQEVVTIYPSGSNTSYDGRSGTISLANSYGDAASITVSQAGYTPPAQTPVTTTITVHSSSSSYLTIPNGYYSASGMSGGTTISYSLVIKNALLADGEVFTLYWRADRTTGGVTSTDAYGNFEAVNTEDETVQTNSNNGTLNIASTLVAGDTVTLYVSIYTF